MCIFVFCVLMLKRAACDAFRPFLAGENNVEA